MNHSCAAVYTNSILKHGIEHSRFFVPAKLSEARRTGGTRERNEAKPGRKRCCANDMLSMRISITYFRNRILLPIPMLVKRNMQIPMDFECFGIARRRRFPEKKVLHGILGGSKQGLRRSPKSCTRKEHESATTQSRGGVKGQRPLWGLGQRPNCSAGDQYAKRAQQRCRQRSVPASNFARPQTRPPSCSSPKFP